MHLFSQINIEMQIAKWMQNLATTSAKTKGNKNKCFDDLRLMAGKKESHTKLLVHMPPTCEYVCILFVICIVVAASN